MSEALHTLYPLCPRGHELSPKNMRREYPRASGFRLVVRCRACDRERKRQAYENDPGFRARQRAYAHWFVCGHPEGKIWDEIKQDFS